MKTRNKKTKKRDHSVLTSQDRGQNIKNSKPYLCCSSYSVVLGEVFLIWNCRCVEQLLPATDRQKLLSCSASPYYFSMMHDDVTATRCLISANIDLNAGFEATDDDEYQPKVLRYFNSEVRFGRCFSPLVVIALYEYSLQHANALLDAGACPDARRPCRVPPLLPALDMFNLELVRCLVAAGASVNVYHRRVSGNMSLIVCLHFWRGLDLMLRCGAEPESLFGRPHPQDSSAEADWSDDDCMEDYEYEFGTLATPIPFWRIIAEAQYVMTRRGVTLAQVLHLILQFTASVRLEERLAGYVNSTYEWLSLKAIAGCISQCTLNWQFCLLFVSA